MATSYNWKLKFGTMSGVKTWTFKFAETDSTDEDVKALMDAMIANGSIYKYPPLTKDSAMIVTTQTKEYNVN